ncbi:MAG: DNA mismatch repair protein MutS [candidate division CPR1 bacterium ADurb.Bin160]|uniref:DNA mismatch repair protein MutS n=1 Tax=candidate division CPR1 bacterium ADurb.Bin160 TaxID=1852826 RepID=A0A1V5ZKD3_9BACT|nr:MAG: DNA mismatch repair protein MutS [candidate division CPR1 bacterium ADurb.Bin160]
MDVAKLAGIPNVILQRAEENLSNLHSSTDKKNIKDFNQNLFDINRFAQVENPKYEKIKSILDSFDINNITPLQALQLLNKLKSL